MTDHKVHVFIERQSNHLVILYQGHAYTKYDTDAEGAIFWKCGMKKDCCAVLLTDLLMGNPLLWYPHNHYPLEEGAVEKDDDLKPLFAIWKYVKRNWTCFKSLLFGCYPKWRD